MLYHIILCVAIYKGSLICANTQRDQTFFFYIEKENTYTPHTHTHSTHTHGKNEKLQQHSLKPEGQSSVIPPCPFGVSYYILPGTLCWLSQRQDHSSPHNS